jgi:glycosyltransferase involved in cell wall biosynthesis
VSPAPIRVLHIISGLTTGGAERLIVSAVTGLPGRTFDQAVCCLALRGPLAEEVERAGAPLWWIGAFPGFRHPAAFWRLVRTIRSFRPDIVHTHLQSANLYGRLAAWLAGVPVIIATEHNVYHAKPQRYIRVERWLAGRTQAIVAVSSEVRRVLSAQLQLPLQSIQLIYNGVPDRRPSVSGAAAYRRRFAENDGPVVIGCVASLTPKKGHIVLLEAVAQLNAAGRWCTLAIAGDGPDRTALEAAARRLNVSGRVHFLGNISDVPDLLSSLDIFVLPSSVEGLPLALLEAMLARIPVIATRVGGVPEIVVDGSNGLLVDAGSAQQLADTIERLIASPVLRQQLATAGRETVLRDFTETTYLNRLSTLYTDLTRA